MIWKPSSIQFPRYSHTTAWALFWGGIKSLPLRSVLFNKHVLVKSMSQISVVVICEMSRHLLCTTVCVCVRLWLTNDQSKTRQRELEMIHILHEKNKIQIPIEDFLTKLLHRQFIVRSASICLYVCVCILSCVFLHVCVQHCVFINVCICAFAVYGWSKHCLVSCSLLYILNKSNKCSLLPQDRLLGKDGEVSEGLE